MRLPAWLIRLCFVAAVGWLLPSSAGCAFAQNGKQKPPQVCRVNANVEIQHDQDTFVTKLEISTEGGQLVWSDLLCGLARARGYDDGELVELLPSGGFQLDRTWAKATVFAMNQIGRPYFTFAIKDRVASPEKTLVVGLNRLVLLESKRRFKQRVKSLLTMADVRKTRSKFGLRRPRGLSDETSQLVVSVHGYNAYAGDLEHVMAGPKANGLLCARFSYPNDQSIDHSAQLLSGELKRLANEFPTLNVSLVTHSMGGLVARRTIEDASLDPGNVRRLIMICPPNHGSELAQFAFAMDLWQFLTNRLRSKDLSFFYASVEDGLAEAATDLEPDSIF